MCGIVGFVGDNEVEKTLINCLKKLEYRGYDSSGIAVISKGKIVVTKAQGKICKLEAKIKPATSVTCGIGHTRWATHGKATTRNAHPHSSANGEWSVVHNGIIENFDKLKNTLKNDGVQFLSQTDTEVISQLLGRSGKKGIGALISVCNQLEGSWALACLNKFDEKTIYLARNKSPLYVCSKGENSFVASDPICFAELKVPYYSLEDGEFCVASAKNLQFFDKNEREIAKEANKLSLNFLDASKGQFEHFMQKEIEEIPSALQRVANTYNGGAAFLKFKKCLISKINRIKIVGCGTAFHSGLMGATFLENMLNVESTAHIASEFRYQNPILDNHTMCIFVSQSGETADTICALELAKEKGSLVVVLTNVPYSTIAKKADIVLPICAGPEIAVASTKAYVCQLAVFFLLAKFLKQRKYEKKSFDTKEIFDLSQKVFIPTKNELEKITKLLLSAPNIFFLGRDKDFFTAQESSLKMKEITYLNATAIPTGELKHGVLALVEKNSALMIIATEKRLLEKTLNGANEVFARGGKIVLVSPFEVKDECQQGIVAHLKLPNIDEDMLQIISVVPMQELAYQVCIAKHLNPDQPRNLAKSVTVE
jgi:glucosamine--fructose-6-phosphate aminotransferase (isomerizing)